MESERQGGSEDVNTFTQPDLIDTKEHSSQ